MYQREGDGMSTKVKTCTVKFSNRTPLVVNEKTFPPCKRDGCYFFDTEREACMFVDAPMNGIIKKKGDEIMSLRKELKTRRAVREAASNVQ